MSSYADVIFGDGESGGGGGGGGGGKSPLMSPLLEPRDDDESVTYIQTEYSSSNELLKKNKDGEEENVVDDENFVYDNEDELTCDVLFDKVGWGKWLFVLAGMAMPRFEWCSNRYTRNIHVVLMAAIWLLLLLRFTQAHMEPCVALRVAWPCMLCLPMVGVVFMKTHVARDKVLLRILNNCELPLLSQPVIARTQDSNVSTRIMGHLWYEEESLLAYRSRMLKYHMRSIVVLAVLLAAFALVSMMNSRQTHVGWMDDRMVDRVGHMWFGILVVTMAWMATVCLVAYHVISLELHMLERQIKHFGLWLLDYLQCFTDDAGSSDHASTLMDVWQVIRTTMKAAAQGYAVYGIAIHTMVLVYLFALLLAGSGVCPSRGVLSQFIAVLVCGWPVATTYAVWQKVRSEYFQVRGIMNKVTAQVEYSKVVNSLGDGDYSTTIASGGNGDKPPTTTVNIDDVVDFVMVTQEPSSRHALNLTRSIRSPTIGVWTALKIVGEITLFTAILSVVVLALSGTQLYYTMPSCVKTKHGSFTINDSECSQLLRIMRRINDSAVTTYALFVFSIFAASMTSFRHIYTLFLFNCAFAVGGGVYAGFTGIFTFERVLKMLLVVPCGGFAWLTGRYLSHILRSTRRVGQLAGWQIFAQVIAFFFVMYLFFPGLAVFVRGAHSYGLKHSTRDYVAMVVMFPLLQYVIELVLRAIVHKMLKADMLDRLPESVYILTSPSSAIMIMMRNIVVSVIPLSQQVQVMIIYCLFRSAKRCLAPFRQFLWEQSVSQLKVIAQSVFGYTPRKLSDRERARNNSIEEQCAIRSDSLYMHESLFYIIGGVLASIFGPIIVRLTQHIRHLHQNSVQFTLWSIFIQFGTTVVVSSFVMLIEQNYLQLDLQEQWRVYKWSYIKWMSYFTLLAAMLCQYGMVLIVENF